MRAWATACVIALASCSSRPPPATPPPGPTGAPPDAAVAPPAQSPLCEPGECPATAPLYPTERCPDGVHTGGRGPCVRFADGTCNWSRLVCPAGDGAPCAAADCALPVPAAWT